MKGSASLEAVLVLHCFWWCACAVPPLPGDQPMGQYSLSATQGVRGYYGVPDVEGGARCELEEITGADFDFEATLTRDSASEQAWVILNGYAREATFDGLILNSQAEASRIFSRCTTCPTHVVETMTVAVLSRSQAGAGECPEGALDGGVPMPDADAGIRGPQQTSSGFDAVRLCGELSTQVVADVLADGGACEPQCAGCTVRYQLRGERR